MPPHRSQRHRATSPPAPSTSSASSSLPLPCGALNKVFTGHAQRLLDEFEKEVQGMGHAEVSMLRGDVYSLLRLIEQRDTGTLEAMASLGCREQHDAGQLGGGAGTPKQHDKVQHGGGSGTREQHDDEQDERNKRFWLAVYSNYALELKETWS